MKITKTSFQYNQEITNRQKANIGCMVCPCCGEKKTWEHYMKKGKLNKGVLAGGMVKTWTEGIFKPKVLHADYYKCMTCGAEWESDPYEE